jgi:uncharacterized protein YggE
MLRFSQIALALLTLVPAVPAGAQSAPPIPPDLPIVTVRGEGVVRMAPDRALVRVGAESRSRDPKEAQNSNAAAMSAVLQKITGTGIPKDAVRTLVVSLQQEYDFSGGRQTPRGYLARNVVEVRVDDLSKLGDVLDASVSSGATSIQGLQFDLKERTKVEREALTRAVADATARAEAAASGARKAVDRVIRIDETTQGPIMRPQAEFRMAAESAGAPPATPVAEGEIEIRSIVTLTAVIK